MLGGKRRGDDTQRRRHVKTEAGAGVMHLQAKDCQGLLATTRSQERSMEQILP